MSRIKLLRHPNGRVCKYHWHGKKHEFVANKVKGELKSAVCKLCGRAKNHARHTRNNPVQQPVYYGGSKRAAYKSFRELVEHSRRMKEGTAV